ncbi:MAG: hypothetical protein A2Y40_06655 [Candidatus Margulisbacteria bacterium GWF2_35_9]|nr:MAG: hypothetical protein A2Y40_06655 [Candidatus Margulisbacteria bacterium GWF2_35_9]
MSKITPNKYSTYNCIENCIANICELNNVNHIPLFLFSWDFGYNQSKSTIGEKIHYHYSCDIDFEKTINLSKKYLNIQIINNKLNSEEIIENVLGGKNLIINIDSFDCSWNLAFQKFHYNHYYLLSKNSTTNEIIAIDSYSSPDIIFIDKNTLRKTLNTYSIDLYSNINKSLQELKSEFLNICLSNIQKNIFELMREFGNDLLKINSIQDLSPQITDVSNSHIIRRLSYIANSRFNVMSLLSLLNYNHKYILVMGEIHNEWEKLKNLFIKIIISKRTNLTLQAIEKIFYISKIEEKLCSNIISSKGM